MSNYANAIKAWSQKNKYRYAGTTTSWAGGCAALDFRSQNETFGWVKPPIVTGPAIAIAHESAKHMPGGKLEQNWGKAKIGWTHFFDIGKDGHVETDLNGGGHDLFGATAHCRVFWVSDGGINSVEEYCHATGAKYLGCADNYGGGIRKLPKEAVVPTPTPAPVVVPPVVAPPVVQPPVVTPPAPHVITVNGVLEKNAKANVIVNAPHTATLTAQADGNGVLIVNGVKRWETGTAGRATNTYWVNRGFGRLQLHGTANGKDVTLWGSGTFSLGATVRLWPNGTLLIMTTSGRVIWKAKLTPAP